MRKETDLDSPKRRPDIGNRQTINLASNGHADGQHRVPRGKNGPETDCEIDLIAYALPTLAHPRAITEENKTDNAKHDRTDAPQTCDF